MAAMAQAGVLAGCVVLNDLHLANRLRDAGAQWVVVREYDLEFLPNLSGSADDSQTGKDWWQTRRGRYLDNGLDKRVFVELLCEKNSPIDAYFERGVMEAAAQDGYKVGLFGDSHGNPAGDTFPIVWKHRVDSGCLEFAARTGSVYIYHSYGALHNGKESDDPGCAIWYDDAGNELRRDDAAWTYYGGRHRLAYESFVPTAQRIPVIFGEAGPSDAVYRGPQQIINAFRGYRERLKDDPYVKAVCHWAVGQQHPWESSDFGIALPAIYDWLRTL